MNSMQNILLEEFENLKGILIAATNLKANLDPAFDRRFLYKITFGKPDIKSREAIWKTKFPALPVHNAAVLASRFDLSGGQIENVARKYTVELAVSGAEPSVEKIQLFCEEENSSGEGNSVIGFRV
jgi:SpoVK/Ycf46/Vps4 family AAA+-type ATPase